MVSLALCIAAGTVAAENFQEDKAIESYRLQLLEIGFSGVSKMPLNPHIKNRSRAQQKVVEACLKLGQPKTAELYIVQIENWQRWMGFANLAYYYTSAGNVDAANVAMQQSEAMLNMVDEVSSGEVLATTPSPLIDSLEGWRYKQVKAKIYEIHYLLGSPIVPTSTLERDFDEDLSASLQVKQIDGDSSTYASAMVQMASLAENTNFEVVHHALQGMVQLADKYYAELDLTTWMDEEILPRFKNTPVFMRVDILVRLTRIALKHTDPTQAKMICDLMDGYIDDAALPVGFHIIEKMKVIALRFESGDQALAKKQLDIWFGSYTENKGLIVDIDRAEIVCRMAENYHLTGQSDNALELYEQAVFEGQVNPNSRPCADALNAICCSMAINGVEPSERLFEALTEMNNQLASPW